MNSTCTHTSHKNMARIDAAENKYIGMQKVASLAIVILAWSISSLVHVIKDAGWTLTIDSFALGSSHKSRRFFAVHFKNQDGFYCTFILVGYCT